MLREQAAMLREQAATLREQAAMLREQAATPAPRRSSVDRDMAAWRERVDGWVPQESIRRTCACRGAENGWAPHGELKVDFVHAGRHQRASEDRRKTGPLFRLGGFERRRGYAHCPRGGRRALDCFARRVFFPTRRDTLTHIMYPRACLYT